MPPDGARNPQHAPGRPAGAAPQQADTVAALAASAHALALSPTPEHAQLLALAGFGDLLLRWNRTYNLTAIREPAEVLTHHLADCMAVVMPLRRVLADGPPGRLLDVGSGGGLPGAVLAILGPDLAVTTVDAVAKKAAFVRQAAAELRLPNLQALHARVEALPPVSGGYRVICSRAFAQLADFVAATRHLLAPNGVWMAMKGRAPTDEIAALPASVDVFHVEPLTVPGLDAQRCLVWMKGKR